MDLKPIASTIAVKLIESDEKTINKSFNSLNSNELEHLSTNSVGSHFMQQVLNMCHAKISLVASYQAQLRPQISQPSQPPSIRQMRCSSLGVPPLDTSIFFPALFCVSKLSELSQPAIHPWSKPLLVVSLTIGLGLTSILKDPFSFHHQKFRPQSVRHALPNMADWLATVKFLRASHHGSRNENLLL